MTIKLMQGVALAVTMVFAATATASAAEGERQYQHFQPQPSETLSQAIMNLNKYNAELQALVNGDLTANDMAKVHELTYTLEVALAKVNKELAMAANALEAVHLGSESMNQARVKSFGEAYLERVNHLLGEHKKHH